MDLCINITIFSLCCILCFVIVLKVTIVVLICNVMVLSFNVTIFNFYLFLCFTICYMFMFCYSYKRRRYSFKGQRYCFKLYGLLVFTACIAYSCFVNVFSDIVVVLQVTVMVFKHQMLLVLICVASYALLLF